MNYSFHPKAEQELTSAIDYYEDQHRDLGFSFAIEVLLTIRRITAHPASGTTISGRIRRLLINRFPFVYYIILMRYVIRFSSLPLCICEETRITGNSGLKIDLCTGSIVMLSATQCSCVKSKHVSSAMALLY
ncbi:MAG: type II toxin-antitoxin system RelE/ParE family toxin [Cyclonatronaceae bacterium]